MLIDCDSCTVRGAACSGCVVSALLDRPPGQPLLTAEEQHAIEVFTRAGFDVEVLARPEPTATPVRLTSRTRRRRHVA
ncbi:hypothetical protein I0C86_00115 [Plantactinospora sp. S1510]|uniref:4Fe-4S ferredoxin-type domain-containing protein n=1 Tax=Plantactinospora alkalitolerans TaxID=2789879 RepID=A0ABS0GNC3_9ACTN|nr:hypothetical protein [Plantactinospora alkalitolerans]MBF9127407.1 hypothetical protein [Plantactinospora alkalitolerans]